MHSLLISHETQTPFILYIYIYGTCKVRVYVLMLIEGFAGRGSYQTLGKPIKAIAALW